MIRELHEQIEDEAFDIKFDEFEDLIKFDLFTSKEVALIRVRSLQVSIVIPFSNLSACLAFTTGVRLSLKKGLSRYYDWKSVTDISLARWKDYTIRDGRLSALIASSGRIC